MNQDVAQRLMAGRRWVVGGVVLALAAVGPGPPWLSGGVSELLGSPPSLAQTAGMLLSFSAVISTQRSTLAPSRLISCVLGR